jgi:hypothetical protein
VSYFTDKTYCEICQRHKDFCTCGLHAAPTESAPDAGKLNRLPKVCSSFLPTRDYPDICENCQYVLRCHKESPDALIERIVAKLCAMNGYHINSDKADILRAALREYEVKRSKTR